MIRHSVIRIFIVLMGVLGTVSLYSPTSVRAAQISPPSIEYTASPGDVIRSDFMINGEEKNVEAVKLSIEEFRKVGEENDREFYLPDKNVNSLGNWIVIDGQEIQQVLPARITKIPYHINIPLDAPPGGHYAAIIATDTENVRDENNTQVSLTSRVAGQILLTVRGDVKEELAIDTFQTEDRNWFYPYIPIRFITRIHNTGNVHSTPAGYVEPFFDKKVVKSISLNPTKLAVFPGTVRQFVSSWDDDGPFVLEGNIWQRFWSQVGHEWRHFRLGFFDVRLGMVYGEAKDHAQQQSLRLLIVPYHLLLVILVALIMLIILLKKSRFRISRTSKSK